LGLVEALLGQSRDMTRQGVDLCDIGEADGKCGEQGEESEEKGRIKTKHDL